MKLFAAIPDERIDTVFADPPFNLAKDYGNGKDKDDLENGDYLKWCYRWIDQCIRVLKPGGSIFIYNLPQWAFHLAAHLEQREMKFRHWIAVSMKGTFPRGRKLYPAHYALLYFTKGDPKTFNRVRLPVPACRHCGKDVKDYGGHRKFLNPLGLNLTDFWDDTAPARHRKFKARWHVNELKPVIPARCIELSTNAGDVVLDPFGGGGSTFEAAQVLGRYWIGSEIVDCELVRERFARNLPGVETSRTAAAISAIFVSPNRTKAPAPPCQRLSANSRSTVQKHLFRDLGSMSC
jgi:site-specific DNA-methyltransferase (adenine-specific)